MYLIVEKKNVCILHLILFANTASALACELELVLYLTFLQRCNPADSKLVYL